MRRTLKSTAISFLIGTLSLANQAAHAAIDVSADAHLEPNVRSFLSDLNKNPSPFWELPQPKPQEILSGLQNQTPVDMSGVTTVEKTITQDGRQVKLYIMKPEHMTGKPGVLLFIHGGVWIVGNFDNHKRLLRLLNKFGSVSIKRVKAG